MQISDEMNDHISVYTGIINNKHQHIVFGGGVSGLNEVTFLSRSKIKGEYYLTIRAMDFRLLEKVCFFNNSQNIAISYYGTLVVGKVDDINSFKEVNCFWCNFMNTLCKNSVAVFAGLTRIVIVNQSLDINIYDSSESFNSIKNIDDDKLKIETSSALFEEDDFIMSVPSLDRL